MQHHIVATDHAPGFAKCPLCRGDIVGDALSFIEFGSHRHQAGFSSSGSRSSPLDLVNRIIEIVQSSSEEPEVSTSSLHGDHHVNDGFKLDRLLDTSTSQRTRWIKRIQQAASAILHRRWDREEYHEDIRGDDEEEHVVDDEEQRANDRSMVLLEQSLENMEARNERPLTDVRVDTVCFYFMMAGCFPIFFFLGFSIIAPILGLPGLLLWIAHFIMIRLNEIH